MQVQGTQGVHVAKASRQALSQGLIHPKELQMDSIETLRKSCLKKQTELRSLLMDPTKFGQAIHLFLSHHALLHSGGPSQIEPRSFADQVLKDMSDKQMRLIPKVGDHSVAWLIWHMARCEDITMNLLVAGTPQVLCLNSWLERINSPICDTGNAMDTAALTNFSNTIDLEALQAYRLAVGCRTQELVRQLKPSDLRRRVEPSRMIQVWKEGAVVEAARSIADYWSKRNIAGLLLMPATRHNLIHLGEALQLKRRSGSVVQQGRSA